MAQLVKNPPSMWETLSLIPGLGRSPGEVKGYLLQYSGLENSMDSLWGCKELDMTEWLTLSADILCWVNLWALMSPSVLRGPGWPVLISSLSLFQEICRGRQGPLLWGLGAGRKWRLGCAVMKYIPDEQKWPKWAMITASHGVSARGNVIGRQMAGIGLF